MTSNSEVKPLENKILTYPIGSEIVGGALYLYGNPNASLVVLMCSGYPDDQYAFIPMAIQLAAAVDCLVGVTACAGYDDREEMPYTKFNPDGYSFDEMTIALKEAAKTLLKESTNKDAKLIGIFHDMGALIGLKYFNRCVEEGEMSKEFTPDKLVLLDVLGPPHPDDPTRLAEDENVIVPKESLYKIAVGLSYRLCLATAFVARRYVSKLLGSIIQKVGQFTMEVLRFFPIYNFDWSSKIQNHPIPVDRMVYMAYPYRTMLKLMFTGRIKELIHDFHLPRNLINTPVLYMYGLEKRVQFHDKYGMVLMENAQTKEGSKSRVVAVEGAGHWLYLQKPELCLDEVVKFVTDA